ncbi:MAG: PIN domain-containing protein [Armatimonadota bacterium]|nr:PIN domain-containing protein [Armatimonadota bacterium]
MPTSSGRSVPEAADARIFVDTGGWIALLSRADAHHAQAAAAWPGILRRFRHLVVTNLVVAESYTFLRHKVGFDAAWTLLDRLQATPRLELVYADAELEGDARALLRQYRDHAFSYADAVSFATMKNRGIAYVFGFDRHFLTAGFELVPPGPASR